MAVLIIVSLIYVLTLYLAVAENVTQEWQQKLASSSLDILQISVGAAIGSLTTAAGAVAQVFARPPD